MPLIDLGEQGMLDIPDDAPPEVLNAVRQKLRGGGQFLKAQEIPKPAGFLESAGRDLISGFGKTAAMVARGGAMLANTFGGVDEEGKQTPGTVAAPRTNGLARTLTDAADSAESYWDEVGKKSTLNPWGKGALQGVGGAFAVGPIPVSGEAAAINAASGVGAGLGGVAADKLDPENKNPLLKAGLSTLAGAVAGTGTALATRARPQSANVAQELMNDLTPSQLQAAQAYKNELAQRGVSIDLAQALTATSGHSGDLSVVRDFLAGRSQGEELKRTLRSQPETLSAETNMTIGSLPGKVWDTPEAANAVQQTATNILNNAKAARTALWEQTVQDGISALKASEGAKVEAARQFQLNTGTSLAEARSRVADLINQLATSNAADATAVAQLNEKLMSSRKILQDLQNFSLPRGNTSTNAGTFSSLPQQGQSIIYDAIGRETQRERLAKSLPSEVPQAAGLDTLRLQRQLQTAQTAQTAAEGAHESAGQALRKAETAANATETLPGPVLARVEDKLQTLIRSRPGSVEAEELSGLLSRMRTDEGMISSPLALNRVLTQFTTRLKSPDLKTQGMDAGTSKFLGSVVDSIRQDLGEGFSPIRAANTAFHTFTENTLNPLRQGPIGRLAQPAGYDPATQAMVSKFSGLMNEGSNPNAATSSIRTAARELSQEDPQVFASAFKTWLSDKIAKGEQASGAGSSLPTVTPEHVWGSLFADGKRWQGMKDATAEMAAIQGVKPEDMVNGLANLRMMTKAMMDHPSGSLGGISPADLRQLGGTSATANLIRLGGYLPNAKAAAAVERSTFGQTLRTLDTILTSPDGAKMLIELGRVPPMSRKAQVILSTYGAQFGNTDGLSGNNSGE